MSKTLAIVKTHLWSYIRKGREKVAWFILLKKKKKKEEDGNAFFVPMFCRDSHFGPYILFLPY